MPIVPPPFNFFYLIFLIFFFCLIFFLGGGVCWKNEKYLFVFHWECTRVRSGNKQLDLQLVR